MVQIVEDQPPLVRFGLFEVDLHTGEIRKSGRKVNLQEQPFQVLTMLLERPGEMVSREELQEKLWPSETVDFDSGLNKSIKKIREALGDSAENPRFVETLPRRGYRFIAGIERIEPFAQMPSNSPHNIEVAAAQLHPFPSRFKHKTWAIVSLICAVLVAGVIGTNLPGWRDQFSTQSGRTPIGSIAVLPLENLSGDSAQEYFADGMTDELITDVAKISSLRVTSRDSTMPTRAFTNRWQR